VLRKFVDSIDFGFDIMWAVALPSLFVLLYTILICSTMVLGAVWGLGVFVWLIPVAFLSPVVYVWSRILEQRYRAYLAMMMSSQPLKWNTEAAIERWLSLVKAKKPEERK
jgi:hypothetical protein